MSATALMMALQYVHEGRPGEASAIARGARERLQHRQESDAAGITQQLVSGLIDVIAGIGTPDGHALASAFVDEALAAGRPAFAAAGRAVDARILLQAGELHDVLVLLAYAELDLADELSWPEPADPPMGPTGPGAAANNLGAAYVELGLLAHAERHLESAARASAEHYGPDFVSQQCIDQLNLVGLHLTWALDCEADSDEAGAQSHGRMGLSHAARAAALARAADWRAAGDFIRVLELGCLSLVDPAAAAARHEVRSIIDTSPEGSLPRSSSCWLVLARLHRLAGDRDAARQAAERAAGSGTPADRDVLLAWREAAVASQSPDSPAQEYMRMLNGRLTEHRNELAADLDHRIELLRLERRHAEVSQAHGRLQDALTRAQAKDAELTHAATHDPLTGLLNRAAVIDRIDLAMMRHRTTSGRFAVAFVDLDGFKRINDEFGHSAGDRALVEVAEQLRATVRDGDAVARIGGDEFLVVMETLRDEEAVAAWARRLGETLRQASIRAWSGRDVGASVGVCLVDGGSPYSPADVIMAADTAMYDAKRSGSGVIVRTLA